MICLIIIIAVFLILVSRCIAESCFMLGMRNEVLESSGKEKLRIAHISDLHKRRFGENNCRLCKAAADGKPDIIFITGDIVSREETDFSVVEATLRELCKIAPVYMIYGNHEQSLPRDMEHKLFDAILRTDVILLRNETISENINGRSITICGLEQSYTTYIKDGKYRDLDGLSRDDMEKLIGSRPEGEVLLLAHNPFFAETYAEWGADKTFSGHIHGGAVRIFGKALLSPERKLFPKYSKGIFDINGMKLLVSAGLGKKRLFDPPEIVFYDI